LIHRHQCWSQTQYSGSTVYDQYRQEVFEHIGDQEIAFETLLETKGLLLTIDLKHFYHNEGYLLKFFCVSRSEAQQRKWSEAKPREILLGELAAC
jgi:hypothetical protein